MFRWKNLFLLVLFSTSSAAWPAGYLCAVGGGSEDYGAWSDGPYRWMAEKSGYGPVLIMHYSDGSAWLERYFKSFGVSSAQSLVIRNSTEANDSSAYLLIRSSRLIFLRGGDQSRYYANWRGTLVERAIREVYESGGVVGGTSAGLAVLGEVDYTAETPASVTSDDAIANPFLRDITLKDDFLPLVSGVIFDSHFTARARLGRLAAFMSNWLQSRGAALIGLGVDENTAACFDPDGTFTVQGGGCVTVLLSSTAPGSAGRSGEALSFTDWSFHMLTPGSRYDTRSQRVILVPAQARIVQPQWQPPAQDAAVLLLAGGTFPADMRTSLQRLLSRAWGDSLLLLGGSKAEAFTAYLSSSLQYSQFKLITLNAAQMQIAVTAAAIERAGALLVAGFSAAEIAALFAGPSLVSAALQQTAARPEVTLMLAGEALPLCGALRLTSAEQKSSDLLYGQLTATTGLSLLPSTAWMYSCFSADDFRENRLGGLYWMLCRDSGMLGVALDKSSAAEYGGSALRPQSRQPLLVMDLQYVSQVDSVNYSMRPGYAFRQSVGFYGGLLHCQSQQDTSLFDLRTRQWQRTTNIRIGAARPPAASESPSLTVFPNPGRGAISFRTKPMLHDRTVVLTIYTINGRLVRSLQTAAADGMVVWDGRDQEGGRMPSGAYLAALDGAEESTRRVFTLLW